MIILPFISFSVCQVKHRFMKYIIKSRRNEQIATTNVYIVVFEISRIYIINSFFKVIYLHVGLCVCVRWHIHDGQKVTLGNPFFPYTMCSEAQTQVFGLLRQAFLPIASSDLTLRISKLLNTLVNCLLALFNNISYYFTQSCISSLLAKLNKLSIKLILEIEFCWQSPEA